MIGTRHSLTASHARTHTCIVARTTFSLSHAVSLTHRSMESNVQFEAFPAETLSLSLSVPFSLSLSPSLSLSLILSHTCTHTHKMKRMLRLDTGHCLEEHTLSLSFSLSLLYSLFLSLSLRFSLISSLSLTRTCTCRSMDDTEWCRVRGCLIFLGHFPQKSRILSGSVAKIDLQLKACYESLPSCTRHSLQKPSLSLTRALSFCLLVCILSLSFFRAHAHTCRYIEAKARAFASIYRVYTYTYKVHSLQNLSLSLSLSLLIRSLSPPFSLSLSLLRGYMKRLDIRHSLHKLSLSLSPSLPPAHTHTNSHRYMQAMEAFSTKTNIISVSVCLHTHIHSLSHTHRYMEGKARFDIFFAETQRQQQELKATYNMHNHEKIRVLRVSRQFRRDNDLEVETKED